MIQSSQPYNGGRYSLEQQTFCLSMLTCLSFNITNFSADAILAKYRNLVQQSLDHPDGKALIGSWRIVWGPVIYADSFVGAKAAVNSMFIAVPECDPTQAVLAIAGTNGVSLMGWMLEDLNVKEKVPWPYGQTTLKPHLSKGIAYALGKTQTLAATDPNTGQAVTARDYFAAHPEIIRLMITGHSLGAALAVTYSLFLENTRAEWDGDSSVALKVLCTAGQSPGDADFAAFYEEKLGAVTTRVWNSLDIVPHAFQPDTTLKIPPIYEPDFPRQPGIEKFVTNILRETEANNYRNILPNTPGFPSKFLRLEDVAGEKYRGFIEFIDGVTGLVKKANVFGSKDLVGSIDFLVHALIQHIFPYFTFFQIDDYIKVMTTVLVASSKPAAAPRRSLWERVKGAWTWLSSFFRRKKASPR